MSNFEERPAPGTKVHVEFDGIVDPDIVPDRAWAVAVSDDPNDARDIGCLHYVNWESDFVTKVADPVPENWPPQPGDTWRLKSVPSYFYHVMRDNIGDGSYNGDNRLYWYTPQGGYKYEINLGNPDMWELAYRPDSE